MISCSLCYTSFHCVGVSCSCCSICVRFFIAKFCLARNVVCRFWRLLGGMGYMIRGLFMGVVVSWMTTVLGLVVVGPGSDPNFD